MVAYAPTLDAPFAACVEVLPVWMGLPKPGGSMGGMVGAGCAFDANVVLKEDVLVAAAGAKVLVADDGDASRSPEISIE